MTVDAAPAISQDARLRIMAARVIAQQRWPYVSSLLFSLKLVELPDDVLPTMAVDDGWRLYYSGAFVMGQTPEALATVLLHEALHCLHSHGSRFHGLNQATHLHPLWNIAGDAGINVILDDASMPWPTVEPVRFAQLAQYGADAAMTTEGVFFALLEAGAHPDSGDCGSVTGGGERAYELPRDHHANPATRSDQQAVIRDRVAQDILTRSRGQGDVPGGLLRWAESVLEPQISWRDALAGRLRRDLSMVAGRRDYIYTRPSRRQEAMRLAGSTALLPAMRQPAPPRVACVIDTSGSISSAELREFAAELVGIARASGVSSGVTVIPCDAQAYPPQRVTSRADIEGLELPGGGGTDMAAGIAAAVELRPRPHIVVVFTDGHTPWPEDPPTRVDSTIVVLNTPRAEGSVPAWASTITLE